MSSVYADKLAKQIVFPVIEKYFHFFEFENFLASSKNIFTGLKQEKFLYFSYFSCFLTFFRNSSR